MDLLPQGFKGATLQRHTVCIRLHIRCMQDLYCLAEVKQTKVTPGQVREDHLGKISSGRPEQHDPNIRSAAGFWVQLQESVLDRVSLHPQNRLYEGRKPESSRSKDDMLESMMCGC